MPSLDQLAQLHHPDIRRPSGQLSAPGPAGVNRHRPLGQLGVGRIRAGPSRLHDACHRSTNWRNYITLISGDRLVNYLLPGRPVLIVTGHWGNWELAGYALGLLGFTTHA